MTILTDIGEFYAATDRLKEERRACWIFSERRNEAVAEHVWHATLLALLNRDIMPTEVDYNHVRNLLTVHDLVEVYAGDTSTWDDTGNANVVQREYDAGERLMALLPTGSPAFTRIDLLWREFQEQRTINSHYARAIDSLHPMFNSWAAGSVGHPLDLTPASYQTSRKREVLDQFDAIRETSWWLVHQAVAQGLMPDDGNVYQDEFGPAASLMIRRSQFITEADALKVVTRANHIISAERVESVAEHCWHATLLALLWFEHAPENVDMNRVMDLLVTHDLVEIYAGDISVYDVTDHDSVNRSEQEAQRRLLHLLPDAASRKHIRDLTDEYLALESPNARFARAIDVMHPLIMTWGPGSHRHPAYVYSPPSVSLFREQKMKHVADYPVLVELLEDILSHAIEQRWATE